MTQLTLLPESEHLKFFGFLGRPDAPQDYVPPVHFPDIFDAKRISLDVETYEPDQLKNGPAVRTGGHIVGVAIKTDSWDGDYFPIAHVNGPNCNPEHVMDWLRHGLARFKGELVGANVVNYDGDYLQFVGVHLPNARWRDIQWAEALLDEYSIDNSLEALATRYLGEGKVTQQLIELYGPDYIKHFREVHPAHAKAYAMGDVIKPLLILDEQKKQLSKEGLLKLFDLECRLAPFLLYMKRKGVRIDLPGAERLNERLKWQIGEGVLRLQEMSGVAVNFYSPASIAKALAEMGVQTPLTEKGHPSVTNDWLQRIGHDGEDCFGTKCPACFAWMLHDVRQMDKARSTFVEGYLLEGNINGRIHCQFHPLRQTDGGQGKRGTITGRLSSSNPNLQNIPVRTELGKEIRKLFIPDEGMDWHAEDYDQTEFRMLVHFAELAKCTGAFEAAEQYRKNPKTDFHEMVMGLTGLERKPSKNLNFALVFGAGLDKTGEMMGLLDEAGHALPQVIDFRDIYNEKVPFAKELYNIASERAQKLGYVKTVLGRRGRFPLWEPRWHDGGHPMAYPKTKAREVYGDEIRRAHTHKALNKAIQGSAADLMKKAMVDAWESGLLADDYFTVSLTVHDELDGSVEPSERGLKRLAELHEVMEKAIPLRIPVLVKWNRAKNWAAAK